MTSSSAGTTVYGGLWAVLVRHFRVPQYPPEVPGSADETAAPFKPAPAFLKYLRLWCWVLILIIDLALLVCWIIILAVNWVVGLALLPVFLAAAIIPNAIAFLSIRLRYDTTWYVMTDRALRIRRGVWVIDERTITYENIQNVKVTQGPVQRHFDIATVVVETAGAGAAVGKQRTVIGNQGVLEGVSDAVTIRDRILEKMRASTATGLGDELPGHGGRGHIATGWSQAQVDLLRQIRRELAAIA